MSEQIITGNDNDVNVWINDLIFWSKELWYENVIQNIETKMNLNRMRINMRNILFSSFCRLNQLKSQSRFDEFDDK